MGWRNVIITQHAKLTYSMGMMIVQTIDGINQIPLDDINLLLISTTQAVITSALVSKLAEKQIKSIFVDDKDQPICETVNYYPPSRSLNVLLKQFHWQQDRKDKLWTAIVAAKIQNQINVLNNYRLPTNKIQQCLEQLEFADSTNREAYAAREYFMTLFSKSFVRKNSDTINSALNYGYSILLSDVNREIEINGCLSYLGIHHHSQENSFNLASDLMEPFRPLVDYWVKAHESISNFTPDIKYGLVELLSLEIKFNNKQVLLANAISDYVRDCLRYLDGDLSTYKMKVGLTNEVPNNAINDNV